MSVNSASWQQAVMEAVRQWQTRLLQLDRRNALLYFKLGKRGVALRGMEPHTLLEELAASRTGLSFSYAERVRPSREPFEVPPAVADSAPQPQVRVIPGDLETDLEPLELQKRLGALSKRNREWQEEQGLNVLSIALGFLRWVDEDQERACSPLLLVPCDLARESPRDPYFLLADESDDPILNPTLRHKLSTAAGIILPEFGDGTIADYWTAIECLARDREGWSVDPSIVVSTFPFSKLAMWEDLDQMASAGVSHPLVRRLAGDADARGEESDKVVAIPRDDVQLHGAKLDDLLDVHDQHAVLDADFSQLRAIELGRSGANLVIHGPPGTGKSQTIANIVATLLADGRRVLFVSEKTAALDVVKRRLTEVGLGGLCLDLHSDRGRKASVYAQLRAALDQPPVESHDFPYARLVARRDELNAIVRALHEVRQPLGLSVFAVHGRIATIGAVPPLRIIVPDIAKLDGDRLLSIHDAAWRIARRAIEFREHHTNRWRALGPVGQSPRLSEMVRHDLTQIRLAIDAIVNATGQVAMACGVDAPSTLSDVMEIFRLLAHLEASPGAVPVHWLEPGGLERVRACTESFRREAADRQVLLEVLASSVSGAPPGPECREWLDIARTIAAEASRWDRIGGPQWSSVMLSEPRSYAARWRGGASALVELLEASSHLQTLLGVRQPVETRLAAEACVGLATRLLKIGTIPATWSTLEATLEVRREAAVARRLRDRLVAMDQALSEVFGPEIFDLVSDDMLVRYRTDYRSPWRWLRPEYRRDHRALRGCLRHPGKLSVEQATVAIERALEISRLRSSWSEGAPRVGEQLGHRFLGLDSDWVAIDSTLAAVMDIYRAQPAQAQTLYSLLIDQPALVHLQDSTSVAWERAATANSVWPDSASCEDAQIPELASDLRALALAAERIASILDALSPFITYPNDLHSLVHLLDVCARFNDLEEGAAAAYDFRASTIGNRFSGWSTGLTDLDTTLEWTQELLTLMGCPLPPGLSERVTKGRPAAAYAAAATSLKGTVAQLRAACSAAESRFPETQLPWGEWDKAPFGMVREWCEDLSAHSDEASDWVEYRSATEALDNIVGTAVADALRAATDDSSLAPNIVLRQVYLSWLEHIYSAVSALQFAPKDLEGVVRDFRELDARLPRAARERVRARYLAGLEDLVNSPRMGELGVLSHQLSLKKRQLPVRKLVARIPNLLQKLKPCFMMSPLAVSQYLPRGAMESDTLTFDTVIFDEASQVFPEDAVPALSRGLQSIVVGDQQQLPPSSFFRSDNFDDDNDDDDQEDADLAVGNRLLRVESILDVMVGMRGAGVSEVYLQVHYRSKHDALIRYSNHYFYEDRLLTFPSALGTRPGLGVRSIYLPDGRFESGGSRTNRIEAERVVEAVFELMETQHPSESIGVVALSRAQADLIQALVDAQRLSNRRFDERFAEDAHERFFVKNLENVQGDERDHVILSVGYGPTTATGVVHNRFGPVNSEGGHRRLNVAVSRARRSITVVHSLLPEDIHSDMQGAKLLRRYLEFLRSGEASIEGAVDRSAGGDAESPFEESVGRALTQRGYRIQRQVGCAKYSIDIAVLSEDGSNFDLAIECDGATYHRSPSARDRDRLRQEILERMGWRGRIHRVWSTAWIRNPEAELGAIEHAVQRARSMPREPEVSVPPAYTAREKEYTPRQVRGEPPPRVTTAPTQPLFATYSEADLSQLSTGLNLLEEASGRIAAIVAAVVRTEAPVHIGIVIDRVRRHYRHQRAGSRIRDAVLRGVREALRQEAVSWLPVEGLAGRRSDFLVVPVDREVQPRGPLKDGSVRDIRHLSAEEIEAGVIRVVRAMVGAPKDEVIVATARAFGYARTGHHVEGRVAQVVDQMVAKKRLVESVGSLVLRD